MDNTNMTDDKVLQFQAEIGKVCIRYGVGALVGIWFENSGGDAYGIANVVDMEEKRLVQVTESIGEKIKKWAEDIQPGGWDMSVKGMVVGFKSQPQKPDKNG